MYKGNYLRSWTTKRNVRTILTQSHIFIYVGNNLFNHIQNYMTFSYST